MLCFQNKKCQICNANFKQILEIRQIAIINIWIFLEANFAYVKNGMMIQKGYTYKSGFGCFYSKSFRSTVLKTFFLKNNT